MTSHIGFCRAFKIVCGLGVPYNASYMPQILKSRLGMTQQESILDYKLVVHGNPQSLLCLKTVISSIASMVCQLHT
jgi:hypothetical protein